MRDLDLSYRPVELLGHIEQAQLERRIIKLDGVELVNAAGESVFLDIQIKPLVDGDAARLGAVVIVQDMTASRRLQEELEHANRQLETACEELQSTNEELQSTNDELQSINDELNHANSFMEAVLSSLQAGVIVLNRDLQILVWNRRATDLWGLRSDEAVGQHLPNIDIGLSMAELRPLIRDVLDGRTTPAASTRTAVNRRGRQVEIRVVCSPLTSELAGVIGVILIMEVPASPAAGQAEPP
ncbi:PAS domain-containing protein [Dactylosporangium sp. AC04546]|uniref:PAS domain-containing protein n=1 Tax=Dactylosporangium sp. AC04546 TaxID=2862460 RepID=UPI001EDDDE0C|nr:PAS domain-containing protein [Dactylosporangium sp. AC04546]WVK81862.1 PAS domain-containing protein [Dactylosporangium sp. AC04546]